MKGRVRNMSDARQIIHRLRMKQSKRFIHKELGVHRTIIRDLERLAIAQCWLDTSLPMPSDEDISKLWLSKSNAIGHPLDIFREQVEQWVKEGLTSVVIHQLLKDKCPCDVQVVRRYRQKHFPKQIEPVMVRSTVAARDLEVDFGELGKFLNAEGELRRVWLLSLRLRHSRKAYREVVLDQTSPTFLMGHVHAFEYFGGVPQNCILDNLKAGVIRSTIENNMINRSYQDLAEHYGFVISPCLPYTPKHKGGVEGDVKYIKRNFIPFFLAKQKERGIKIPKLSDLRDELQKWDQEIADVHLIHGVGRSPLALFESEEKNELRPLPNTRWEPTAWSECEVRREWRIMVNSAFYSVPYQLIGETVVVCITHSLVRIFYQHQEVALHAKATKKFEYKRKAEHAPPFREEVLNCTREGLLFLAEDIGPFTRQIAHDILSHPTIDKLRPVRSMLRLAEKFSKERLERACQRASICKLHSYLSVKNILVNNLDTQPIEISSTEKIIPLPRFRFERDPADYKSSHSVSNTYEEQLEKLHPVSKYGNAMLGAFIGGLADQIIDEELEQNNAPT
jgi:hypothetical protein